MKSLPVARTMSSLEIAELTGKNHKEILRDIRKMVKALDGADLRSHCKAGSYLNSQGKAQPLFNLDKATTITLLSGYDIVARHKIVTRWEQLETERIEEEKNPELAIQRGNDRARKTWLKMGKDDKWIEARTKGVATRKNFTRVLSTHGVYGSHGYQNCTNAIYSSLYGGSTEVVRMKMNLQKSDSIRDNMDEVQLAATQFAEVLALDKIQKQGLKGNAQCEMACSLASKAAANAILQSRKA